MTELRRFPSDAELARYLMGESVPAEVHAIERWLATDAEHPERLGDLQAIIDATAPRQVQWDAARSWERLADGLEPPSRPVVVKEHPRFRTFRRQALMIAASAALVVGGWYAVRAWTPSATTGRELAATSTIERRTGRGERVAFRLPDGTGVMLGPASRFRYSSVAYGRSSRAVELEGDGYFEVVHDDARPFVVHTATALIRDLGTRFVIRARPGAAQVDVGVAEGSVAVGTRAASSHSVVLRQGEAVQLDSAGRGVVERDVNLDRYLGWTEGRLVFERTPLNVVADELERWYDIEIEFTDPSLEHRVLTAAFRDKPAMEALELIAASLDLEISARGKRFTIGALRRHSSNN